MLVPERYRWAVGILDVKPDDTILEIGCGFGHSIPLICEKLRGGRLTAIDRSAELVAAATSRNRQFVESGKARVLHQNLLHSTLPASSFNKIFLFNINAFWMDPASELVEVRRVLTSDGRFFLFHQPPPAHDVDEFAEAFRINLEKNDFRLAGAFKDSREPVRSVALISVPIPQ